MPRKTAPGTKKGTVILGGHCAFDDRRSCNACCQWYVARTFRRPGGNLAGKCVVYDIKDLLETIANRMR